MSVWFTESFRGQLLWDLAKLKGLNYDAWATVVGKVDLEFTGGVLDATGEFDEVRYPSGTTSALLDNHHIDHKEFRRIFFDDSRTTEGRGKNGHVTLTLDPHVSKYTTGLHATYGLFLDLVNLPKTFAANDVTAGNSYIGTFIEHAFRAQVGVMKSTPEVALAAFSRLDSNAVKEANRWQVIASRVRAMLTYRWKSGPMREAKGKIPISNRGVPLLTNWTSERGLEFPDDWQIYFDGWITYVQTDRHEDGEFYALTSVDLDRIQQMCISLSMLELHQATWSLTAGNSLTQYRATRRPLMKLFYAAIETSISKTKGANPNNLCRDFRKSFNTYMSMAAGSLSDEGTDAMLSEIRTKQYDKNFNPRRYMNLMITCPFDIAQDLGRLYKLLPAPDYDIGQSFVARQKQHLNMNSINESFDGNPCNLQEFRQYMRKMMILTLTASQKGHGVGTHRSAIKPKWWDDYARAGILPANLSAVDEIDLKGVSPYVERTPEGVASWKDSAVCEENLDEVIETTPASNRKRNMLLRYLFDPSCPDATKARRMLTRPDHVHRVGFKMESHKTEARLFFIGNMADRLVQSEMEENVHRVALNCPGYMIGQTPEFSSRKIMSMVAPRLEADELVYFLNFDISAWSPGMRSDIQRLSHEIWGEVFNRPEFSQAHRINENSIVVLNKRGYNGLYRNPGANFEGYNGKEMSFLHCALMGYSVYRYRRETKDALTVRLCAYIDDGLASFKAKRAEGPGRFLKFASVVENTYQSLGFLLEKSKCFMSDHFAIFLNEIYLNGRHVTYGLRAIMRVGTKVFEPHETLCARANSYFSGTQGAMRAGLDILAGFVTYLWLVARMLLVYGTKKHLDARASVLYALTPRGLGGVGCPGFAGLSTNLVTDTFVEGVACLQELAKAYPQYRQKVISLLRQSVAIRTNTSILMSPTVIGDAVAPMLEGRLRNAVAGALKKAKLAPKSRAYVNMCKSSDLEAFADSILLQSANVVPSLFADLLASTPFALFMALVRKFESSRTMVSLVGGKKMKDLAKENRKDAITSMRAFVRR